MMMPPWHKLLAASDLALADAVKLYRAEGAANQTTDGIPSNGLANAAHMSNYKKLQAAAPAELISKAEPDVSVKPCQASQSKCANCGQPPMPGICVLQLAALATRLDTFEQHAQL